MTSQMRKKLIDRRKMFLNLEIPDRRINSFLSRPQPLFPPILKRKGKQRMTALSTGVELKAALPKLARSLLRPLWIGSEAHLISFSF